MSEVKPLLSELQEAWQKLDSERPACVLSPMTPQEIDFDRQMKKVGVLLQRLVAELPQQAKTQSQIVDEFIIENQKLIDKGFSFKEIQSSSLCTRKLVALEALLPTQEPSCEEASPRNEGKEKKET